MLLVGDGRPADLHVRRPADPALRALDRPLPAGTRDLGEAEVTGIWVAAATAAGLTTDDPDGYPQSDVEGPEIPAGGRRQRG